MALLSFTKQKSLSTFAEDIVVTQAVIDGFATIINDDAVSFVLSKDTVVQYTRAHYPIDYFHLNRNYRERDFEWKTFDTVLIHSVLNANCLYSRVNFFNPLKNANLLPLDAAFQNLCNPFTDQLLHMFKITCTD